MSVVQRTYPNSHEPTPTEERMAVDDWQSMVRTWNYGGTDEPPGFRFVWWIEVYTGHPNTEDRERLTIEVVPRPEPEDAARTLPIDERLSRLTIGYRDAQVQMWASLPEAMALAGQIMESVSVGEGGG